MEPAGVEAATAGAGVPEVEAKLVWHMAVSVKTREVVEVEEEAVS